MQIKPSYNQIESLLEKLFNNKIIQYEKSRNFAYFDNDILKNVSGLSPFISRGVIKEEFLLRKVINTKKNSNKFIQEIFWRIYWQGWLENHVNVWKRYESQLDQIKKSRLIDMKNYKFAISGNTKIVAFDEWVKILKESGYLHNHVRMWFASIWIHYLGIPWQLGANFFYEHLLDGDIASNLLSWRWVAGLQTKGKKYIATEENINKYTFNRYGDLKLPKLKDIILDNEENQKSIINYSKLEKSVKDCAFFITENNLNFGSLKNCKYNIKIIVLIRFNFLSINKSKIVLEFHKKLCEEFINKFDCKKIKYYEILLPDQKDKLNKLLKDHSIKNIIYDYLRCGYEKNIIQNYFFNLNKNIKIYDVLDDFYVRAWKFCDKGFFKFKDKIPMLLDKLR
ncbi:MAG: Deoxyribodipyrimidine photo-lyase [Alphaproteobacteria bacterium MarineAlpha9_Bin4]|nr:hypothetical protein [Pelagibacterales bacterium]PPR26791.1 MAG: Deoxyribodipyrimidine photo-lyase [Alphaproteobacteria bacterium MarineAlpha9_Bin4]